jgi:hypothetical protein
MKTNNLAQKSYSRIIKFAQLSLKPSNEILSPVLITKYLTTGLQKYIDGSTVLHKNLEFYQGL